MRNLSLMASCAALALMAAPNDQGGAPTPDPEAEARAAEEAAAAAAEAEAAAAKAEEEAAAEAAAAKKAEEEAAAAREAEAKAAASNKSVLMIWVQPGHERYFIGQPVEFPAADAEFLRTAGRAREASKAELKAWKVGKKAAE